ncbi:MAG: molybdopterin-dependent oxidoreductase [Acidobacteria bacterium]|nr:molybdopterin-dependent oxidoreductase [Acidobacteriota bacterium]
MDRRNFIKISALTGTSATLASCGNPEYRLIRFVPEDRLTAGVAVWKPSICPLCPAGCGLLARVMEGDVEVIRNGQRGITKMGLAKKLEGNPAHPVNQGKLCARGQAAGEIAYHPDRVGHPLKRSGARGEGRFEEISWDDALAELVSRLDALAAADSQKSLAFLTSPRRGFRNDLTALFANRFGAPAPIAYEFFGNDVLRRANALSFGKDQIPTPDLAESRYVISFGADFLGTWNSPVAQNIGYGLMRQGRPGVRGKFVQVEPRMSQTGANADEWIPAKPGQEGVLALGLAHAIMKAGLRKAGDAGRAGMLIEGWASGLAEYTPREVEKRTGVAAARIERLAKEFAGQGPAAAVIGDAPLAQSNGLFNALAVNALNALVGSVEKPGGILFTPQLRPAPANSPATSINKVAAEVLLLDGANPVFSTPKAWQARETLMKVPFIVSFGSFIDETSVLADLILPDHSFLESWVDIAPESGSKLAVAAVAPPVMRPLHDTRAMPDVLLDISRRLAKPLNLPWRNFEDMLTAEFEKLPGVNWKAALLKGGWWGPTFGRSQTAPTDRPGRIQTAPPVQFSEPRFDGDASEYPFHFLPYASQAFLDGSLAHLPMLQELPDPMTSAMWSSWVEINPQAAERLGIRQGDLVEVRSTQGALRAPAFPHPGIAPDVIAMPVGQGHETYTRYASGRGENPVGILAPVVEPETGALAWAATRVKITRVADADGRLVLFAGSLRDQPESPHR